MPTILVSYRRDDSKWITGRIVDRLKQHYGRDNVFMDIDAIPVGRDFREHLRNTLDHCDVLLAIIGPRWLVADRAGRPRIMDSADWVRVEIETALTKRIPVVPVLIDDAGMPRPNELPDSLQDFAYRQAAMIDTDRDFHSHMDRLIDAISELASQPKQSRRPSIVDAKTAGGSSSDTSGGLEAALVARRRVAPAAEVAKSQSALGSSPQVAKIRSPSASSPQVAAAATANAAGPLVGNKSVAPAPTSSSSLTGWRSRLVIGGVGVGILACLAGAVYWQWTGMTSPEVKERTAAEPATSPRPAPPQTSAATTKTMDRFFELRPLGHPPEPATLGPATAPTSSDRVKTVPVRAGQQTQAPQSAAVTPGAAMAQRVVLYEEDSNDPKGKRFVGSAIWRTEMVSPTPGMPQELAIRADVEIPERRIAMVWSLRRNTDPNLPASHTVEVVFKLPSDFAEGGISNVPGILMKQAEETRGTPLSGLAVKITNGFFLIGLSAIDADRQRNVQLLKERAWFDIPVVYNNNRRAILALEKGATGERAFADAFTVWRQ